MRAVAPEVVGRRRAESYIGERPVTSLPIRSLPIPLARGRSSVAEKQSSPQSLSGSWTKITPELSGVVDGRKKPEFDVQRISTILNRVISVQIVAVFDDGVVVDERVEVTRRRTTRNAFPGCQWVSSTFHTPTITMPPRKNDDYMEVDSDGSFPSDVDEVYNGKSKGKGKGKTTERKTREKGKSKNNEVRRESSASSLFAKLAKSSNRTLGRRRMFALGIPSRRTRRVVCRVPWKIS